MVKRRSSGGRAVALKAPPRKRKLHSSKASSRSGAGTLYSVHPGVAMVQKWIVELPVKTGRSLDQWLKHIRLDGPQTEKDCREWLKHAHSMGTNMAWWLAEKAFGDSSSLAKETPEGYLALAPQYVDEMYGGTRAALRPIHDELVRLVQLLGDDV